MSDALLTINELAVSYGDITVIRDVDASVERGDIVSLVGANGTGKTTLMKTIAGAKKPDTGSIVFDGRMIVGKQPHEIVDLGLAYVPERHRIFPEMTVYENLITATSPVRDQDNEAALDHVFDLFPILDERRKQKAGTMSGGQQQMLAIGQGLVVEPTLLMLDEPTLGLAPKIIEEVKETIISISENEDVTVLLVDEDVEMAQEISDEMYLLQRDTLHYLGTDDEFKRRYGELIEESLN